MHIKISDKRNSLDMAMPSDFPSYNIHIGLARDAGKEKVANSHVKKKVQKFCMSWL